MGSQGTPPWADEGGAPRSQVRGRREEDPGTNDGTVHRAGLACAYETWSCGQRFAGLARGLAPTTCPEGEMTVTLTKRGGRMSRSVIECHMMWHEPESHGAQRRTRPQYRAHPRGHELGSGQGEGWGTVSKGPRMGWGWQQRTEGMGWASRSSN